MQLVRVVASTLAVTIAGATPPSPANVEPFTQTYFGTVRTDPYHWMEAGGPSLDAYLTSQTGYTRSLLAANPGRPKVAAAMREAFSEAATVTSNVKRVGSRVFFLQSLPGSSDQSLLMRVDGRNETHVVVNAMALPKDTALAWFEPSPGGTKIAYGATASSEKATIHVCDVTGARDRIEAIEPNVIPDATWRNDSAFYYSTVFEIEPARTEESFLHVVGARRGSDAPIAGFGANGPMGSKTDRSIFTTYSVLANDAVLALPSRDGTPHTPVYVAPVAQATSAGGPWRRFFGLEDEIARAAISKRYVYGLSDRGDGRRTLLIRDRKTGALVRSIAPSDSGLRTDVFANAAGVYVAVRTGAEMRLDRLDALGNRLGEIPLPHANALGNLNDDPAKATFALSVATFADPQHWYEVTPHARIRDLHVSGPPPDILASTRYSDGFATSTDGTKIPYTVIYPAGAKKDGALPTLVYGYGAYGYDIEPPAPPEITALSELGIVLVLAHVRGGGEFGEPWHLAGKGATKQRTIDDFIACSRAAIADGWTSPAKLAGIGASAGGITIGGAITQHPELFAVAISQVGFNDMVDIEKMPNGPGQVPEFGSVATADGFRDLLEMSAYDHVVPAAYPATILTTGKADVRNAPWQVAKMTARLQAATTSGKPVLLRADVQGHGLINDPSLAVDENADIYTFMLWQLGEPDFQPATPERSAQPPSF